MGTVTTRNTRAAILDAAEEFLQRRSFNSFSYQHISTSLGLKKASLHYHFPGKTDLGLALIARYREQFREWCLACEATTGSPVEALEAYVRLSEEFLSGSKICPGGVLSVEFNTIGEPMQVALRGLYDDLHAWLRDQLARGLAAGLFAFPGSADAQARLVSTTVQGALQQARSCGTDRFRDAVDQLLALMVP